MLSIDNRPQWRVISNGSQSYIKPLIEPYKDNIWLNTPITRVVRHHNGVTLYSFDKSYNFDQVIFACHSDQVLKMLDEPTQLESDILGALPFQRNDVVLHTDTRLLPKRKRAWASWNYHIPQRKNDMAMVTYNMNMLQNFDDASEIFLVTLNRTTEIDPNKIIELYNNNLLPSNLKQPKI